MLQTIKRIAVSCRHKELDTIPFMMFGMSAGGQFNYEFACWAPGRVHAFVVNKGGIYYTALAPPASWNIPGLFITGEKDSPYRINIVKGIFSINRRFGAKWTYAQEQGAEHVIGKSDILAQAFFREVIKHDNKQLNSSDTSYIGLVDKNQLIINEPGRNMFSDLTSWIVSKQFGDYWIDFIISVY
jgi:pimeloyl-ACP methyl ester carboxylesterase